MKKKEAEIEKKAGIKSANPDLIVRPNSKNGERKKEIVCRKFGDAREAICGKNLSYSIWVVQLIIDVGLKYWEGLVIKK
ncbi:hypothetical protein BpHYR1_014916 [Brachionus plicatilis]|uniref:Uncharacterized protein n=1 Tax=Brachionus plicatilis TaxID=10195 RepID=A0A3M7R962_BRAPC|nr:hypothetical protein BpHYR1_014916 [Brachionus plicatilis]